MSECVSKCSYHSCCLYWTKAVKISLFVSVVSNSLDLLLVYASFAIVLKVVMLNLAWKLKAEQMGFFTLSEWVRGMTELQ